MEIPRELQEILVSEPYTLGGTVRFRGTRVPVQALLDTLTHGLPVADFLEGFPDVTEGQAQAVVEWQGDQARRVFGLESVA